MTRTSSHDVRMRGFTNRATVAEATAWVDAHASRLGAESVEYLEAHGRVLAADVRSMLDVPSFDRSAMDGYALRGGETDGASDYNPLEFEIAGRSMPGIPFEGQVPPSTAVRIMTGAPVPDGADAVLPAEYAEERDGRVRISTAVTPGKHIGRRGEDVAAGTVVLATGRRLRPQDVGLSASVGVSEVSVVRRPRVRIVVTGNELAAPGTTLAPFQIYESNSSVLRGLLARDGGVLESQRNVPDDRDAISAAIDPGDDADVVLVSGGSSVGVEDHAPTLLADLGELAIHGVAMRPSSPAGIGRVGDAPVFLLPGNPVSCLCAYDFFAGRAIRLKGGRPADWPYPLLRATLSRKIVSAVGRVDYCRVEVSDAGEVVPLAISGASMLSSTTRADGFVVVAAESEGLAPGATVKVHLYCLD